MTMVQNQNSGVIQSKPTTKLGLPNPSNMNINSTEIITHTDSSGVTHTIIVTVTNSDGTDKALVMFIDTTFEPDGSDGSPGLRIILNDGDVYTGVPFEDERDDMYDCKG